MTRIAAITSGKNTPSTRFRIRQHIEPLRQAGFDIQEYYPVLDKNAGIPSIVTDFTGTRVLPVLDPLWRGMKLGARVPGLIGSWRSDITWLGRELLPARFSLEGLLKRPVAFDIDDAIWLGRPNGERTVQKIARLAHTVIAGNRYIADWVGQYNSNVHIVPTAVDTEKFRPRVEHKDDRQRFTVGWTGISGNFSYLYDIEQGLYQFLSKFNAELLVVAELPPRFKILKEDMVRFVQWSPDTEATAIQEMDVGIMPLTSTPWTQGKCSLKMIAYMACGIPVVVSPVGMNSDILAMGDIGTAASTETEFRETLESYFHDRELRKRLGANGRSLCLKHFSRRVVSTQLADIFGTMPGN